MARTGLFVPTKLLKSKSTNPHAMVFVDGQNLTHAVRHAFGYTYPNFDVLKLAREICAAKHWELVQVHFYTGIPSATDDSRWHEFWSAKLLAMSRNPAVRVYSRPLRYRMKSIRLPDGEKLAIRVGEEKGIDVRLALDVVRHAVTGEYDIAVILSQDQDFTEVASEVRRISRKQKRWIKVASAYPVGPSTRNTRGINRTDWIQIDREMYDRCIDERDYRAGV